MVVVAVDGKYPALPVLVVTSESSVLVDALEEALIAIEFVEVPKGDRTLVVKELFEVVREESEALVLAKFEDDDDTADTELCALQVPDRG